MKKQRQLPRVHVGPLGVSFRRASQEVLAGVLGIAASLTTGLTACNSAPPQVELTPWQPVAPSQEETLPASMEVLTPKAYVSKVKNLLTGLPPSDAEVAAVASDPAALRGLIDQWMAHPEHRAKMLDFFRNAFQQNQVTLADLQTSLGLPNGFYVNDAGVSSIAPLLERSLMDSFALTVWKLVAEEKPFHEALTTRRYMLNPPLMSLLSFLDELMVSDSGYVSNRFLSRKPSFSFTLDASTTYIPIEQTLNPNSPNYMRWMHPAGTSCRQPTLTYGSGQTQGGNPDNVINLFNFIFGKMQGGCTFTVNSFKSQWRASDWDDWRMVEIEQAARTDETSPLFYDLEAMRSTFSMRLHTPRVGFIGSLAFQTNWATNAANVSRVTANQALIVALGKSFDGSGTTVPIFDGTLDKDHATPGSSCYGCHQTLDPFKQFFRQSYSLFYRDQDDPTQKRQPAAFAFEGVQATGEGIGDLAKILASHPRFAAAWTQKLCHWANSTPCMEDDPEFLRVADVFRRSGHKWKVLVRELLSSPLITLARNTRTQEVRGSTLSVARRDHLCVALSNRLGLSDVCAMLTSEPTAMSAAIRRYAAFVPVDGYSRGFEIASLPTDPNAFFRIGTESMCMLLAEQVVDAGEKTRYSSSEPGAAISDFVATIMALSPSDSRAAPAQQILQEHYETTLSSGASTSEALKSTFTLACESPSSVIMGL